MKSLLYTFAHFLQRFLFYFLKDLYGIKKDYNSFNFIEKFSFDLLLDTALMKLLIGKINNH